MSCRRQTRRRLTGSPSCWSACERSRSHTHRPAALRLSASGCTRAFHCSDKAGTVGAMMIITGSSSASRSTGPAGMGGSSVEVFTDGAERRGTPASRDEKRTAGAPRADCRATGCCQNRPALLPNRVRCASLGVQKGRFSAGNRPFCGPWESKNSCKASDSVAQNEVESLHYIAP